MPLFWNRWSTRSRGDARARVLRRERVWSSREPVDQRWNFPLSEKVFKIRSLIHLWPPRWRERVRQPLSSFAELLKVKRRIRIKSLFASRAGAASGPPAVRAEIHQRPADRTNEPEEAGEWVSSRGHRNHGETAKAPAGPVQTSSGSV